MCDINRGIQTGRVQSFSTFVLSWILTRRGVKIRTTLIDSFYTTFDKNQYKKCYFELDLHFFFKCFAHATIRSPLVGHCLIVALGSPSQLPISPPPPPLPAATFHLTTYFLKIPGALSLSFCLSLCTRRQQFFVFSILMFRRRISPFMQGSVCCGSSLHGIVL